MNNAVAMVAVEHDKRLNVALALRSAGFRIFPIPGNKKAPPVKGWKSFAAEADEAKVRAHWGTSPQDNIGIACGDGLLVLDRDGERGARSLAALEAKHGKLPETLTVRTQSGGHHYYFTGPDVSNSASTISEGLDIRGKGGYVVAPGSVTDKGAYTVEREAEIAPAPQWLIDLCSAPREKTNNGDAVPDASAETVERAAEWLSSQPPAIEGQGGDAHTFKVACGLRDLGLSEGQAFELLGGEWNSRCEPSWSAGELGAKVRNVYSYAQNEAGSKVVLPSDFAIVEQPPAKTEQPPAPEQSADKSPLYTFPRQDGRLCINLARAPTKRRYIVPDFVPAGITAILAGHGGSYKSLVMLYLAVAVALGRPLFPDMPPCEPGAVLLALGEEDAPEAYRRLYGIAEQLSLTRDELELLATRLLLFPCLGKDVRFTAHRHGVLVSTGVAQIIATRMQEHAQACGLPAALVGLDHFMLFSGGETNSNEDASAYARETGAIVTATGATVVTVAHAPKGDDGKKLSQHSVLGAVSTGNLARLILLVQRMTRDEAKKLRIGDESERLGWVNIWTGKTNYTGLGRGLWLRERVTDHQTVVLEAGEPQTASSPEDQEAAFTACEAVVAFLRAEDARGIRYTRNTLDYAATEGRVSGIKRAAVRDALTQLTQLGVLDEVTLPKGERHGARKNYLKVLRDLELSERFS